MKLYVKRFHDGRITGPCDEEQIIESWSKSGPILDADLVSPDSEHWVPILLAYSRLPDGTYGIDKSKFSSVAKKPSASVGKIAIAAFFALLVIFIFNWSPVLSIVLLIPFTVIAFVIAGMAAENLVIGGIIGALVFIIGLGYIKSRFSLEENLPPATHPKTDGVFESATEKLDKGLPLNEREQKRLNDILTYDDKKKAEEIEKRNGERP